MESSKKIDSKIIIWFDGNPNVLDFNSNVSLMITSDFVLILSEISSDSSKKIKFSCVSILAENSRNSKISTNMLCFWASTSMLKFITSLTVTLFGSSSKISSENANFSETVILFLKSFDSVWYTNSAWFSSIGMVYKSSFPICPTNLSEILVSLIVVWVAPRKYFASPKIISSS